MSFARKRVISSGLVVTGVVLVVIIWLVAAIRPTVFDETVGGSHIRFRAEHRLVMPSMCVPLHWEVESARLVELDGEVTTPSGELVTCPVTNVRHTLRIVDAKGEEHRYTAYVGVFLKGRTSRLFFAFSIFGLAFYIATVTAFKGVLWPPRYLGRFRGELGAIAGLSLTIAVLFGAITQSMSSDGRSDWGFWFNLSEGIRNGRTSLLAVPHMLYPVLATVVDTVFPPQGGAILATASSVLASWGVYFVLRSAFNEYSPRASTLASAVLALALMLVGPIFLLTPNQLYLGYLPPHVYHSPTMYVLKPFAIPLFAAGLYALSQAPPVGLVSANQITVIVLLLSALAPLAKPSYTISLIPALALMTVWQRWHNQRVRWTLLASLLVPALLVLAAQYLLTYSGGQADQVRFNPLGFLSAHDRVSWLLAPMFLLSITFPLAVYGLYFRQARRDLGLNFAWLTFLIGAFYSYFLTETKRLVDGNFTWSGQITIFVLFVISMRFLLVQEVRENTSFHWRSLSRRFWLCAVLFAIHFACGLYWYSTELLGLRKW